MDNSLIKYSEYFILFYKMTDVTNNENIKKNPRDLIRYSQSNDFLYQYKWYNSRFLSKEKINGSVFSPELNCQ